MAEQKTLENHLKTIIHIDLDCFYAQVEMIKNPNLKHVPLGIQQKNIVVTTNYIAREFGLSKCVLVSEALEKCPSLVLVNGEDLHDYRHKSYEVTALLNSYSNLTERLGLDENFIDVTSLVDERLLKENNVETVGHVFGDDSNLCDCGCKLRLQMGTVIAQEIRDKIKSELDLTSSAGISYNKLLAKIAGSLYKPNKQTVVFPNNGAELMLQLSAVSKIPGIGNTLSTQLSNIGISTVKDLQNANLVKLNNIFGADKAKFIYNLSFGVDETPVKTSGKPHSIGIEDSCKVISAEKEVKEKLEQLLNRLLILLGEDGRIPRTIKLTIRKHDKAKNRSTRETRQCNISPSLFNTSDISKLSQENINKIIGIVMRLFQKLVNPRESYHLTLLGLSFTKFLEKRSSVNILTKFIDKQIEVQSVTDIESKVISTTCDKEILTPITLPVENNIEPSTKKRKYSTENIDSPSELPVAELHLNGEPANGTSSDCQDSTSSNNDTNKLNNNIKCPPNVANDVFQELPQFLQQELWGDYKRNREDEESAMRTKKPKPNSILNYFNKI